MVKYPVYKLKGEPKCQKFMNDITKTIGNTLLVRINKLTKGFNATILAKLESFNPLSSLKDRIGVSMMNAAEK